MAHQVAILGAGVIGCAIGWELARRGVDVLVLDGEGAVGHGSTAASCGIVRRFYSTPTMTALAEEGARIWADWGRHLGLDGDSGLLARFERPGMLFIPPRLDAGVEAIVAHMRAVGVPVEVLTAAQVRTRFPFLDVGSHSPIRRPGDADFLDPTGRDIDGAVFEADAGYVVSPQLATHNLATAGRRDGVRFRLGQRVVRVTPGAGADRFVLELADGSTVTAAVLVNAAGPHSAAVHRMVGVELPIATRALRREVGAVPNPVRGTGQVLPVVGDVDSGIYFRPEAGGADIIVGSLDPKCDALEWLDDPDAGDVDCSVDGFERQVMRLLKRLPTARLTARRGLAGLYDVTPLDWNPVLDRTDRAGYYVAIGTSGSSFKTAPVIGQLMAELITAGEAGRDHDAEPVQYRLPRTGFEVDLAFFSRLRGAHATSASVLG